LGVLSLGLGSREMLDRAAVFVGPGLTEEDMSEIDTDLIDLHPPIRRGDLRDAMDAGYRIIAIIDGEFYQNLAVSPKEILVGLRDGRHIIGGSSMGALRAAEMDVYGMEGVGRIYAWYRRGIITRDDDVALMFGSCDVGSYRAVTVPMVNVVWAMSEFKRLNLMPSGSRRRVTATARRIHWASRNWPGICEGAGLNDNDREIVRTWSHNPDSDLKRIDARQVVAHTVVRVQSQREGKMMTAQVGGS
jgi:hypothetical protein